MHNHVDQADVYPIAVPQPDNSDLVTPPAPTLNAPTDGTLDRTAYLHKRLGTSPACNWNAGVSPLVALDNVRWNPAAGVWWAVGGANTDLVKSSIDYGKTWTSIAIGLDALAVFDLDFDAAGNAAIANHNSRTLYNWTASTSTWSHDLLAIIGTINKPRVRFDPVNSIWICFYNDTTAVTGAMRAATSTDRITWTDRSAQLPSAFTVVGTFNARMGVGNGRVVVASKLAGTTITMASVATTAVAAAWSSASIVAAALTTVTDCSDPIYSAEDSAWLIALYGTIGVVNATEIWKSTDGGLTWTRTITIAASSVRVVQLANVGHVFVGLTIDGFTVYSLDVGATWFPAGVQVSASTATAHAMSSGGGGLMVVDYGGGSFGSRSSVRLANQAAAALT